MTRIQNALADGYRLAPRPDSEMTLNYGRIIATDPTQRTVDVALMRGGIIRNVRVLSGTVGTHEGSGSLPTVANPASATQSPGGVVTDLRPSNDKDTYCVVGYVQGDSRRPYVLGMMPPEFFETSFPAALNVEVNKHANGMYVNFTADGLELSHPSGTYIRIGVGTAKTNLNNQNTDAAKVPFSDSTGTATATPDIMISHNSGASVRIGTTGVITITKAGGGSFALETHTHGGVTAGGSNTTGPV